MNLDALIRKGRLPWNPRGEATDPDVWHEYEIPLVGTFRIDGDLVLFTQVLESSQRFSVWAYVCPSSTEIEEISTMTFTSVDDLRDYVERVFQGREAVLALARDDRIIGHWTRAEITGDGLVAAVESFLNDILKSVNAVQDTERRVLAKLAGLEATESELTPA